MEQLRNNLLLVKEKYASYSNKFNEAGDNANDILTTIQKKYGVKFSPFSFCYKADLQREIEEAFERLERMYAGEDVYYSFESEEDYAEVYKNLQKNLNGKEEFIENKLGKEALVLFSPEPEPVKKPFMRYVWLVGGLLFSFLGVPLLIGGWKFLTINSKVKAYKKYFDVKEKYGDAFNKCLAEYRPEAVPTIDEAKKEINDVLAKAEKAFNYDALKKEEEELQAELNNLIKGYKLELSLYEIGRFVEFLSNAGSIEEAVENYKRVVAEEIAIRREIDAQCSACLYSRTKNCTLGRRNCNSFVPK